MMILYFFLGFVWLLLGAIGGCILLPKLNNKSEIADRNMIVFGSTICMPISLAIAIALMLTGKRENIFRIRKKDVLTKDQIWTKLYKRHSAEFADDIILLLFNE